MPSKKSALALAGAYLLLAVLLSWPTAAQLTTHLPGDGGDDPAIAWNLWWVKYALLNAGQNPFHTDFMFYPLGINLAFYTLTTLNAVTALPFTLNLGVAAASNLHMWFTFVAGGFGAFLLARYLLAVVMRLPASPQTIWWSAALAGGFYAFAGSKWFYVALGQFNIASTHWIPFAVLYLIRAHRQPRRLKNALLAGLFLAMQAWAEMTYASFILVFLAIFWLWEFGFWLWDRVLPKRKKLKVGEAPPKPPGLRRFHLLSAAVLLLTFAVGISPILAAMLPDMLAEGDFLVEGSGFADAFSADLLGFVVPTMLHPLLGGLVTHTGIAAFDKGQHIYLGLTLLTLAAVAAATGWRNRHLRFWLLAALLFALLALGPVITVNGYATGLPGPFVILQQLPFFKGNRYPSRYSVMLILSLSVLAAYALAQLQTRILGKRGDAPQSPRPAALVAVAFAALFLFEHLSAPLPQSDMRPPAPYQTIAADPAAGTVLDIPFAWRNGFRITGALTTQFMFGQFYQTLHQRPMLQGNTSRNPEYKFQYFTEAPVINSLLALQTGKTLPPERLAADASLAAEVLRFFNLSHIAVRPDASGSEIVTPQAAIPYIEQLFPVEKIHADPALTLYRVTLPAAPPQWRIEPASPLTPLYLGEGWGRLAPNAPLLAQRRNARLMLPLPPGADTRLTLRLRQPEGIPLEGQTVSLTANGWQSPPQPVSAGWQDLSFTLPAQAVQPGITNLWLRFAQAAPVPLSPPLDVTVISAGEEVGGFGHIFLNGRDISPNGRGYNVALISPSGEARAAAFDTHLDPAASAALVAFLADAPPGATIAIAAADEASASLSAAAVTAIQQATGASGDLRGCFRCSHAIISGPNGVQESLEALRPAALVTRLGLTEPTAAAQIESITIEAAP